MITQIFRDFRIFGHLRQIENASMRKTSSSIKPAITNGVLPLISAPSKTI
jgi:hypothetical protein